MKNLLPSIFYPLPSTFYLPPSIFYLLPSDISFDIPNSTDIIAANWGRFSGPLYFYTEFIFFFVIILKPNYLPENVILEALK